MTEQRAGFQFKQFTIYHDLCGMKVGTDSILLGSWLETHDGDRVLDIGTGSGLLSIMLAQKSASSCLITGIDIEANAVEQARDNARNSPWESKLDFHCCPLQQWQPEQPYSLIVTNPPYYPAGQELAPGRKEARHTGCLSHLELVSCAAQLLSPEGRLALVLPEQFCEALIAYARRVGLILKRSLNIRTTPTKAVTRRLMEFTFVCAQVEADELVIHRQGGEYSSAYKALTRDYYLKF